MNDTQQQGTQHRKRTYRKPAFIQVSLRPEEAVLGHCKGTGKFGPSTSASGCNYYAKCNALGS
jgi:hypothetical protein